MIEERKMDWEGLVITYKHFKESADINCDAVDFIDYISVTAGGIDIKRYFNDDFFNKMDREIYKWEMRE